MMEYPERARGSACGSSASVRFRQSRHRRARVSTRRSEDRHRLPGCFLGADSASVTSRATSSMAATVSVFMSVLETRPSCRCFAKARRSPQDRTCAGQLDSTLCGIWWPDDAADHQREGSGGLHRDAFDLRLSLCRFRQRHGQHTAPEFCFDLVNVDTRRQRDRAVVSLPLGSGPPL